jgi:hypothetical protein
MTDRWAPPISVGARPQRTDSVPTISGPWDETWPGPKGSLQPFLPLFLFYFFSFSVLILFDFFGFKMHEFE